MSATILVRWQERRGTAAALAALNEIPLDGERILETDTLREKIGDGVTHYNSLAYISYGTLTGINEQTGTTYTLASTDATQAVRCTNAAAITLTIPKNSTTALPLYRAIPIFQGGAGIVTIAGASGVTLESPSGAATIGVGDFRTLFQRATDIWVIG